MRLIVVRCSAIQSGRLDTVLPQPLRLTLVEHDGSLLPDARLGGKKPPATTVR